MPNPVRNLCAFCIAVAAALLLVTGCSAPPTNFSQYPGFAQFYATHPPRSTPPSAADQALLARYRPRFFLPPGHAGMLDFYQDYIAQGQLVAGSGAVISTQVTPAILNAHKEDATAVFTHSPQPQATTRATIFGRVDHDDLELNGTRHAFTFLSYHAVFRSSGLVAGFEGWRAGLLSLIANLDDWHQLDHYTAATVVLGADARPVALMLQQHNYHHTYVFGPGMPLPADARVAVDIAIRSNELYPHAPQQMRHRAVRFNSPDELRYLLGFGSKPSIANEDITHGQQEAPYQLAFLPPSDAFYTFKGFLGQRRKLPGRDGPPGADFNTLPEVKPLAAQMLMGFWREGNAGDLARLDATYAKTGKQLDFVQAQALPFLQAVGVLP
jgi:hypothetical protein